MALASLPPCWEVPGPPATAALGHCRELGGRDPPKSLSGEGKIFLQLNGLPKGDGRARQEIGVELPFGSSKRARLEGLVGLRWSWSQGSWFLGISGSALK